LLFAAAEVFEKISFLAIASNLVTYLTRQLHEGPATASINVYNWQGASFLLAILGGFIADTYWGRFWTMLNFSLSFLLVSNFIFIFFSFIFSIPVDSHAQT
jgi:peptide/histidine transporter 3/4